MKLTWKEEGLSNEALAKKFGLSPGDVTIYVYVNKKNDFLATGRDDREDKNKGYPGEENGRQLF